MEQTRKSIDNLSLQNRIDELNNIYELHKKFGNIAFNAIEKCYTNSGYAKGIDRITKLSYENKFSKKEFIFNPIKIIAEFLKGYFIERGGNMPKIWSEKNIVYLKTEFCKYCLTIEAEQTARHCHDDICAIYCRAFVKGLISIFEDLFPGIMINFYNVSSRRDCKESDCLEAFQIIIPKH
ncbi:MAG: hypothetical protein HQ534_03565 [Armatimonadetes bacterium]|nr:hypothetical protein [Armatimonadota bacterium]